MDDAKPRKCFIPQNNRTKCKQPTPRYDRHLSRALTEPSTIEPERSGNDRAVHLQQKYQHDGRHGNYRDGDLKNQSVDTSKSISKRYLEKSEGQFERRYVSAGISGPNIGDRHHGRRFDYEVPKIRKQNWRQVDHAVTNIEEYTSEESEPNGHRRFQSTRKHGTSRLNSKHAVLTKFTDKIYTRNQPKINYSSDESNYSDATRDDTYSVVSPAKFPVPTVRARSFNRGNHLAGYSTSGKWSCTTKPPCDDIYEFPADETEDSSDDDDDDADGLITDQPMNKAYDEYKTTPRPRYKRATSSNCQRNKMTTVEPIRGRSYCETKAEVQQNVDNYREYKRTTRPQIPEIPQYENARWSQGGNVREELPRCENNIPMKDSSDDIYAFPRDEDDSSSNDYQTRYLVAAQTNHGKSNVKRIIPVESYVISEPQAGRTTPSWEKETREIRTMKRENGRDFDHDQFEHRNKSASRTDVFEIHEKAAQKNVLEKKSSDEFQAQKKQHKESNKESNVDLNGFKRHAMKSCTKTKRVPKSKSKLSRDLLRKLKKVLTLEETKSSAIVKNDDSTSCASEDFDANFENVEKEVFAKIEQLKAALVKNNTNGVDGRVADPTKRTPEHNDTLGKNLERKQDISTPHEDNRTVENTMKTKVDKTTTHELKGIVEPLKTSNIRVSSSDDRIVTMKRRNNLHVSFDEAALTKTNEPSKEYVDAVTKLENLEINRLPKSTKDTVVRTQNGNGTKAESIGKAIDTSNVKYTGNPDKNGRNRNSKDGFSFNRDEVVQFLNQDKLLLMSNEVEKKVTGVQLLHAIVKSFQHNSRMIQFILNENILSFLTIETLLASDICTELTCASINIISEHACFYANNYAKEFLTNLVRALDVSLEDGQYVNSVPLLFETLAKMIANIKEGDANSRSFLDRTKLFMCVQKVQNLLGLSRIDLHGHCVNLVARLVQETQAVDKNLVRMIANIRDISRGVLVKAFSKTGTFKNELTKVNNLKNKINSPTNNEKVKTDLMNPTDDFVKNGPITSNLKDKVDNSDLNGAIITAKLKNKIDNPVKNEMSKGDLESFSNTARHKIDAENMRTVRAFMLANARLFLECARLCEASDMDVQNRRAHVENIQKRNETLLFLTEKKETNSETKADIKGTEFVKEECDSKVRKEAGDLKSMNEHSHEMKELLKLVLANFNENTMHENIKTGLMELEYWIDAFQTASILLKYSTVNELKMKRILRCVVDIMEKYQTRIIDEVNRGKDNIHGLHFDNRSNNIKVNNNEFDVNNNIKNKIYGPDARNNMKININELVDNNNIKDYKIHGLDVNNNTKDNIQNDNALASAIKNFWKSAADNIFQTNAIGDLINENLRNVLTIPRHRWLRTLLNDRCDVGLKFTILALVYVLYFCKLQVHVFQSDSLLYIFHSVSNHLPDYMTKIFLFLACVERNSQLIQALTGPIERCPNLTAVDTDYDVVLANWNAFGSNRFKVFLALKYLSRVSEKRMRHFVQFTLINDNVLFTLISMLLEKPLDQTYLQQITNIVMVKINKYRTTHIVDHLWSLLSEVLRNYDPAFFNNVKCFAELCLGKLPSLLQLETERMDASPKTIINANAKTTKSSSTGDETLLVSDKLNRLTHIDELLAKFLLKVEITENNLPLLMQLETMMFLILKRTKTVNNKRIVQINANITGVTTGTTVLLKNINAAETSKFTSFYLAFANDIIDLCGAYNIKCHIEFDYTFFFKQIINGELIYMEQLLKVVQTLFVNLRNPLLFNTALKFQENFIHNEFLYDYVYTFLLSLLLVHDHLYKGILTTLTLMLKLNGDGVHSNPFNYTIVQYFVRHRNYSVSFLHFINHLLDLYVRNYVDCSRCVGMPRRQKVVELVQTNVEVLGERYGEANVLQSLRNKLRRLTITNEESDTHSND
ncbi:hypothetical protein M8J75_000928 [Diaphorina citri]|nr:hypothetical protein M8J75_000928 [Diaphorina citri]